MSKQIKEKVRKTIRVTDEHKQLLEKGSRILAAEMAINRVKASGYVYSEVKPMSKDDAKEVSDYFYDKAKERKVVTRSPGYKKAMSEAFKLVSAELDKLR